MDDVVPLPRGVYEDSTPTRKRIFAVGGHGRRVGVWRIFRSEDPSEVAAMARRHLDRVDPPTILFGKAA